MLMLEMMSKYCLCSEVQTGHLLIHLRVCRDFRDMRIVSVIALGRLFVNQY